MMIQCAAPPDSSLASNYTPRPSQDHERFSPFFETTGGLEPYLAYEKSNSHIQDSSSRFCLLGTFAVCPESARGCPTARWRIPQLHHGRRAKRAQKPYHRRWKHSNWVAFAF